VGITKAIKGIEMEIGNLIGTRWPNVVEYLKTEFRGSLEELEERAKEAVRGVFYKEFSELFKKILEQCYEFVKMVRTQFSIPNNLSKPPHIVIVPPNIPSIPEQEPVCPPEEPASLPKQDPDTPPKQEQEEIVPPHIKQDSISLLSEASINNSNTESTTNISHAIKRSRSGTRRQRKPEQQSFSTPVQTLPAQNSTKWRCFKCTVTNTKGDKCQMCGEPKPLMFVVAPSPVPSTFNQDVRPTTKWICSCCKFVNSSTFRFCAMCNQENCVPDKTICSCSNGVKCTNCMKLKSHAKRSISSPQISIKPNENVPPQLAQSYLKANNPAPFRNISNTVKGRKKNVPVSYVAEL